MSVPITRTPLVKIATAPALVPVCAWCKRVRFAGRYMTVEEAEAVGLMPTWYELTHGICPECRQSQCIPIVSKAA